MVCYSHHQAQPEYARIFFIQQIMLMCVSFLGVGGTLMTWCGWKKRMDDYDF